MYLRCHKLHLHCHCHQSHHILIGSQMTNKINKEETEVKLTNQQHISINTKNEYSISKVCAEGKITNQHGLKTH